MNDAKIRCIAGVMHSIVSYGLASNGAVFVRISISVGRVDTIQKGNK